MRGPPLPVKAAGDFPRALLAAVAILTLTSGAPGGELPIGSLPSPVGAIAYTPGRGLRVGDTGLVLGGYTNLNLTRDEGGPVRFSVDDLSLFVSWHPVARLHLFSELELEDLVDIDSHGGHSPSTFTAERLYGDLAVSDQLGVRVGKFLTPVGRWNVIHAQPLVWTTSRPLVTEVPFDPHTTGAMLFGLLFPAAGGVSWSLYGQFTDQFDPVPVPQPARRSGGARLDYAAPGGWSVGASYLASNLASGNTGSWQHLVGVDTLWQRGPFELMGEFAFVEPTHGPGQEWGLYLQGVREVLPRVSVVGRYEHFDQPTPAPAANLFVLGVAWKPWPYVVLKGEYLFADHFVDEEPPGVKLSLAILF